MKNALIVMTMVTVSWVSWYSPHIGFADEPQGKIVVELRLDPDVPAGSVQKLIGEFTTEFKDISILLAESDDGKNVARMMADKHTSFKLVQDVLKFLNAQQHVKLGISLAQPKSVETNDDSTPPIGPQQPDETIKVFDLQVIDAKDCVAMILDVYQSDAPSIAALDSRTLVVRGSGDLLDEIESLLQELDKSRAKNTANIEPIALLINMLSAVADTPASELAEQIRLHRELAADSEAKSLALARQLRSTAQTDPDQAKALTEEVKAAFQKRQKLHRLELAQLLQRTQAMSDTVERRDKIADQIVRQRVGDLLNPDLQWDTTQIAKDTPQRPVVRQRQSVEKQTITVSGDSENSVKETEQILAEILASGEPQLGNVDIQVTNGQVILRGAEMDVKQVQELIKEVDRRIAENKNPLQAVLQTTNRFLELIKVGRIAEASQHTISPALATAYSRMDGINKLRIEEVVANRASAIVVMTTSPDISDGNHLTFECKRVRMRDGNRWQVGSIRFDQKVRLASRIDTFLQSNPDAQIAYLDEQGKPEATSVTLQFQRAPWPGVVQWLGKHMNAELDLINDSSLIGGFNYQLDRKISPQHAYRIIQAELRARDSDVLIVQRGSSPVGAAQDAAVQGEIVQINQGLLSVSIGQDDGLSAKDVVEVYRDGKFIGLIEVGFVDPNTAVARPGVGYKETEFRTGDTVQLQTLKSKSDEVPNELRSALDTIQQFISLVHQQRFAEAAKLTRTDADHAAEFLQIPNSDRCRIVELIDASPDVLAISAEMEIGDRGKAQFVFTLSGNVIEDIDLEVASGVQAERARFLKIHPQAKRVVVPAK